MSDLRTVDLFCGGGGLSSGLAMAAERKDCEVQLAAVNHSDTAIETHKRNHPWADHYCKGVDQIKPIEVFPEGDITLLCAAPSCTDHSSAKGGQPVNAQERMAPFAVLDWIAQLNPESVLIENVKEFRKWGPVINGQPTRNGKFFEAWVDAVEDGLGYTVEHRVLTAADYGDPTSRERLFVVARRDDAPLWPTPTHAEDPEDDDDREPWRTAAEIIDWADRGDSIWTRDRELPRVHSPLKNTTMARIAKGIRQHCHDALDPYADAIADIGGEEVYALREDVVDAADAEAAAAERDEPFLVQGEVAVQDQRGDAFVLGQHGNASARDVDDEPVPTVATRGAIGLYHPEAFVLPRNGAHGDKFSNAAYDPDDRPFHTVTAGNHDGFLVSPFIIKYYKDGEAVSVDEPLPTVTTKDRFALIVPECYPLGLDINFRMLKPRELAAAQGFPADYDFAGGSKKAVTKQIGNAVPVNLATALCSQLLSEGSPTLEAFGGGASTGVTTDDD